MPPKHDHRGALAAAVESLGPVERDDAVALTSFVFASMLAAPLRQDLATFIRECLQWSSFMVPVCQCRDGACDGVRRGRGVSVECLRGTSRVARCDAPASLSLSLLLYLLLLLCLSFSFSVSPSLSLSLLLCLHLYLPVSISLLRLYLSSSLCLYLSFSVSISPSLSVSHSDPRSSLSLCVLYPSGVALVSVSACVRVCVRVRVYRCVCVSVAVSVSALCRLHRRACVVVLQTHHVNPDPLSIESVLHKLAPVDDDDVITPVAASHVQSAGAAADDAAPPTEVEGVDTLAPGDVTTAAASEAADDLKSRMLRYLRRKSGGDMKV